MDKNRYLPILTGTIYASIFGLSFIFAKILLNTMSPMEFLASRFMIAALSMTFLRFIKVISIDLKNKPLKPIIMVSLLQPVLYFICETIGIDMTSASESGLMTSLTPIIVSFLSVIFLKERLKLKQWGFIILSISGVVLINIMKGINTSGNFLGMFFLLLTVSVAAIYNILAKKATELYEPMEMTYVMMWMGALVFNAINFINKLVNKNVSGYFSNIFSYQTLIPLLYLGILSSILAFFLSIYTISKLPLAQAAVFGNVITIVSILGGVIILKEKFYWYDFLGSLMIIIGVWGTVTLGDIKEETMTVEESNKLPLSNENSLL